MDNGNISYLKIAKQLFENTRDEYFSDYIKGWEAKVSGKSQTPPYGVEDTEAFYKGFDNEPPYFEISPEDAFANLSLEEICGNDITSKTADDELRAVSTSFEKEYLEMGGGIITGYFDFLKEIREEITEVEKEKEEIEHLKKVAEAKRIKNAILKRDIPRY